MSWLGHIVTLGRKELFVIARDRQAAALLFAMPAVFVLFLSLALKEVYGEKIGVQLGVVLELEDDGDYAQRIADELRENGGLTLVRRPAGMENAELFRKGEARATVRIPRGFSDDFAAFLEAKGAADFGPSKIEWAASPSLDAAYRLFVEGTLAMTCMRVLQDELSRGQMELGAQLEEMGTELETMGSELESMGVQLEEMGLELERTGAMLAETGTLLEATAAELEQTAALLESSVALLGGTKQQLERAAVAAAAESAASAEAEATRATLAARGVLPEGVFLEEPARPELSFEPPEPGVRAPVAEAPERSASSERPDGTAAVTLPDAPAIEASAALFLAESAASGGVLPTPLQQTVPGWSLFAMFFIVVPLSHGLHRERTEGTLRRMLALAVPRSSIVTGKLAAYVLVGVVQFAGMLAMGLYVVPLLSDLSLELGDQPLVLIPITVACALAATSYGLLVATLARTPEQAAAVGATSVVILSVLGGVMVPHFIMPALLQKLALVSPLYWGHKAYLDVFLHGAGLPEVGLSLLVLVSFALVCLSLSARRVAG
jgi:ABC-type transport system involved in multi-copper enzyme maturation permease subunit